MTTWVEMYHPALPGTPHVRASVQAVAEYAARGWLEVDGSTPAPADIYLTPGVGDLRYAKLGDIPTPGTATGDALRVTFGLSVAATASANATLAVNKHTPVDASGAARTMTLPTGRAEGTRIIVEKVDTSPNPVTVSGSIRGSAGTEQLVGQFEAMSFLADSSGSWHPGPSHKTKTWLDSKYGAAAVATDPAMRAAFAPLPALTGSWVAGTAYTVNQRVVRGRVLYDCITAHTAGTSFLTDLKAGRWSRRGVTGPTPATLASLGDSISMNGAGPGIASTLTANAAIGSTTVTVAAPPGDGTIITFKTELLARTLIRLGSGTSTEYAAVHPSTATTGTTGTGPFVVTLAAATTKAHSAGDRFSTPVVWHGNGRPSAVADACMASGGTLRYAGNYGHGGWNIQQVTATYLPLVLEDLPGYCYVQEGTNTPQVLPGDLNDLLNVWDELLAAGITPVASTLPPNNGGGATLPTHQAYNSAIHREARQRGIPLVDLYGLLVDPATGTYLAANTPDGTHPTDSARLLQGQQIWNALKGTIPAGDGVFVTSNIIGDSTTHPLGNRTNALALTATGGTTFSGNTSSVPAGWNIQAADADGTIDVVTTPPATWKGNAVTITRKAGSSSGTNTVLARDWGGAAFVPGHRYRLSFRINTTGLAAARTAGGTPVAISAKIIDNFNSGYRSFPGFDSVIQDLVDLAVVEEFVAVGGPSTSLFFGVALSGSATATAFSVQIGQLDVVDLTALGEDTLPTYP